MASSILSPDLAVGAAGNAVADMAYLAPMMIVGFWAVLLLATDTFAGPGMRQFQRRLALVGLGLAAVAALNQFGSVDLDAGRSVFAGLLQVDHLAILLDLGVLAIIAATVSFAGDYARSHRFEYGEQESLLFIAGFGIMMLNHAADLVTVFLGIETMSIAIYVLVGARWNHRGSAEAALKYFLMGAFASGLLLMGIALLYGATGTTDLGQLGLRVTSVFTQWGAVQAQVDLGLHPDGAPPGAVHDAVSQAVVGIAPAALFFPGMLLLLVGLLFKLSAVPLHMWTPDAYEGAPSPTTGFMAAGVKIGGIAALIKVFVVTLATQRLATAPYGWTSVVAVVALLTMTVGNFAAVRQYNIKRLLAYSSVAHVGYLLVGVVAAANFYGHAFSAGRAGAADQIQWSLVTGDFALASILFYVLTYGVATVGAFACVSWNGGNKQEATTAHEWAGLAQRHPAMALGLTICLLSLMGMPPTAGFLGKLSVFRSAIENDNPVLRMLVIAALLNSVVGAYYYLRLIVSMYFRSPASGEPETLSGRGAPLTLGLCAAAVLALGIFGDQSFRRAELAASGASFPIGAEGRAKHVDELRARWEAPDEAAVADDGPGLVGEAVAVEAEVEAGAAAGGAAQAPAGE